MKPSRTPTLRWMFVGLAALALAGLLAFLYAPRPLSADVGAVDRGPLAETVADEGVARVREAYVVSAPVGGQLERVDLHVGDWVVANRTLVARLRPAAAQFLDERARAQALAAVSAARSGTESAAAELSRARVIAARARADLQRTETLADKGYASPVARDNAASAAKAAAADVTAASAALSARQADLRAAQAALLGPEASRGDEIRVTSPASGYVTRVLQESSRPVPAGAPLVEVAETSGLEAAVEFLSQDAVRIREGMEAEIYDWGGPVLTGVVRRVEPQGFTKVSALGVEEQRVLVLIQLSGPAEARARLAQGYRLRGRVFVRREASAVRAPIGALVRSAGGWGVYRLETGRARLRPVTLGALTDRLAEVKGGVKPGDAVILFPSDRIRDGVRVKMRPAG